ncbi:hypothetical protein [Candidatus Thioglobus sp.]|jgi:hypothetical protein|uniref:Uncharacterized protein n=1 Tax=hydrothermal vent metagenome TaxID=652676 RepID=A0A1W1D7U1_9ZZZZ|nr:hypothetical protein [Candidatus Thioglobus sp.]HIB28683.1 hypothetical protein [Candidatus Thioglobus sp.]HIB96890.1 hypothetical protein [Candidatus Thioglobus sp.]HIF47550.1 hypothetical protein [Candidatus Thioglobus sp.]HIL04210.1 hypothetical protein [Candidatus Thioglobus autotrophicus]
MSATDNSTKKGHILMVSTMAVTLIAPLALIILSYIGAVSGTAEYVAAFGVIASTIYIIGGSIWMFSQDATDGKNLADG